MLVLELFGQRGRVLALGLRKLDEALFVLECASCRETEIAAQPSATAQTVKRWIVIQRLGAGFATERWR